MKNINHINYVVAFSDGTVKIGVTSRPASRMAELRRLARGRAVPTAAVWTPPSAKAKAFKTEALVCRLYRGSRNAGTREWFDGPDQFHFLKQTTGMAWLLENSGRAYSAREVAV